MSRVPVYNDAGEILGFEQDWSPQDQVDWMHQEYLDRLDAGWDEYDEEDE